MQPIVEDVRSALTATQVRWLIEGASSQTAGFGVEATDLSQTEVTDLGDICTDASVDRSAYATLHGGCQMLLTSPLDWGWAVVRPYMTLTDGLIKARFNLGAYFTNTPKRTRRERPGSYEVQGFGIL